MAKRKYSKKKARAKAKKDPLEYIALPKINVDSNLRLSFFIIFIYILGLLSLLGLFNLAGQVGEVLGKGLGKAFGFGEWLFPFLMLVWGTFLYRGKKAQIKSLHYIGLLLTFISYQTLFHFFYHKDKWLQLAQDLRGGGYVGMYLSIFFDKFFGFWGGLVVIIALFLISWILLLNKPLTHILGKTSWLLWPARLIMNIFKREKKEKEYEEASFEEIPEENLQLSSSEEDLEKELLESEQVKNDLSKMIAFSKKGILKKNKTGKKNIKTKATDWKSKGLKIDLPINLLREESSKGAGDNIERNKEVIQKTLEDFGILVQMEETSVGPTITQYTFKPTEGIKLSRITALNNDLSLALAAHPIRIEAPIPGKSLVGIEVPNKSKAIVGLKKMLSSNDFKVRKSNLMMALGEDVTGESWFYDISKMPHLLVAGATNSGKSVCLNSIIVSLLYQNDPDDLRFIMVDPKKVELTIFNNIPHLLTPVITDVPKTINALKWCLNEMDRRFEILSEAHKKNINSYNEYLISQGRESEKMPYIIFIIDELADLMVAASKDIEASVIRLAQMARAVGIHLILATQRPSVDVITGLIKANIPARIAFSVTSAIDSKTILDISGAEKLLGQGDMLITTPSTSKPKRLQGAFVGDKEIKDICDYLIKRSGGADYLEGITDKQQVKGMGSFGLDGNKNDSEDELFEEAKEIIINANRASTSFLQRRLRIGYGRAASILDSLEESGVIGPSNGSKPREVLVSKDQYEALINQSVSAVGLHSKEDSEAPDNYLGEDLESNDNEEESGAEIVGEKTSEEDENFIAKIIEEEENIVEDENNKEGVDEEIVEVEEDDDKEEDKIEIIQEEEKEVKLKKNKSKKESIVKKEKKDDTGDWFDDGLFFSK